MNKKRLLIVSFVLALTAVVYLFLHNEYDTCLGTSKREYFRLPPSATHVEKRSQELTRSCTVWLKFSMDPAELDDFIASTFIKMPLSSTALPDELDSIAHLQQKTGWKVDDVESYLVSEATGTQERFLDHQFIFVDVRDPEQFIVFLVTNKNWL